ncbi:patatin-like protein 3 [Curcuma longa]|uniref:patatin-like protein 3 n=1 Tax=Curcuma longa TaxID=136217 RepID=UPI003D9E180A
MASPSPAVEPAMDLDKLSYEIFSILESKFLFGYDDPPNLLLSSATFRDGGLRPRLPAGASEGRVRILSVDGGGRPADALLAAASLTRLESSLRRLSGDPSARVADFFDVAAGSGAGGVLAAMLFARGPDGRSLLSAADALGLLLAKSGRSSFAEARRGPLAWWTRRGAARVLRKVLGDATLRDTVKPLLVPCFDLATGAPFLFSRADAVEEDAYDFPLRQVCAATCAAGTAPVEMRSADGRTRIAAVGGGVTMSNPAAAAISHVLNNKCEFPFADGMKDLMVLSLSSTTAGSIGKEMDPRRRRPVPSQAELLRIAGEGVADVVDQAIAMSFGQNRADNYVRIQGNGFELCDQDIPKTRDSSKLLSLLEKQLSQKNVESLLFQGKKISDQTNAEKLDWFAGELVKEDQRRGNSQIPNVVLKQVATPRTSSIAGVAATSEVAPARTSISC